MTTFENFERAFRARVAGCRGRCECGIEYFDTYNGGYSWEEGEFEALQTDVKAKGLDHAVGYVEFEGRRYVDACTCWHERAKRLIAVLHGHAAEIAEFLSLEKARKQREAENAPVVV